MMNIFEVVNQGKHESLVVLFEGSKKELQLRFGADSEVELITENMSSEDAEQFAARFGGKLKTSDWTVAVVHY